MNERVQGNESLETLDRLRKLDPQAISAVHDRYFAKIYRYCMYRVGESSVAEGLASEVFLRLLESLRGSNPPRSSLSGWLHGTASNLVNDHFRAGYRSTEVELDTNMPSTQPSPAKRVEQLDDLQAAREALQHLTPEQQDVLALRFGSGLSVQETADVLGKHGNAVKGLQFRALASLRKRLKEQGA